MILIVCALAAELRYFEKREGIETFACGVGPVEAAAVTAGKLALGTYDAVLNVGIAGAFPGCAQVGEALAVGDESLAELGLEGGGRLALPGGATLVEHARADTQLLACCTRAGVRVGSGLTVAQVTTTGATAARLQARYQADVESMEGFSVLRAAELFGARAVELRGISNYVGDRAASGWDFAAGARAAARALDSVLDQLVQELR